MNEKSEILLYNYYRSSASYRVRIALHFKDIPFKYIPVHLIKDGGEQFSAEYKKLNPLAQVPCLVKDGRPLGQSMAIIQYLEDICPEPRLFPEDFYEKAIVIQLCEAFNSGIQPLQNLSVLAQLETQLGANQEAKNKWIQYWIHRGLESVEQLLSKTAGKYSFGDEITAADCFLVPQVFTAKRFNVDLAPYKNLMRVNMLALEHNAFQMAEPTRQIDYTPT